MRIYLLLPLLPLFFLPLGACDPAEMGKCKEGMYKKSIHSSINCDHSNHKLVEQDEHWLCKCQQSAAPAAAAAPASASAFSVAPPAPKVAPPPPKVKDDYSWLDTSY